MKLFILLSLALITLLLGNAAAICTSFDFSIGNVQNVSNGSHWAVYDSNCNGVDGLTTNQNPCNTGTFSCSPPPMLFVGYKNSFTGTQFTCQRDPNSENCGSDVISVCCRSEGS